MRVVVVLIEWVWVTDNERIEKVVNDVRTAVLNSDAEGVLTHLTSNVTFTGPEASMTSDDTQRLIRASVSSIHLEFAKITDLKISVGQQTRRGTAEFRVFTKGGLKSASNLAEGRTAITGWSLGFRETEPRVWKIDRISQIAQPNGIRALSGRFASSRPELY